ncbi:hypothetical protein SDC9_87736 [bioreactor metagenome]|uniref:Uncharacterized protein n=1 Tax=bioreactor metagenome TaxID=1076179 RepID=A0A644ZJM9_9ZZZZ
MRISTPTGTAVTSITITTSDLDCLTSRNRDRGQHSLVVDHIHIGAILPYPAAISDEVIARKIAR